MACKVCRCECNSLSVLENCGVTGMDMNCEVIDNRELRFPLDIPMAKSGEMLSKRFSMVALATSPRSTAWKKLEILLSASMYTGSGEAMEQGLVLASISEVCAIRRL